MRKIDYKTAKWEKRKAVLIQNIKYDYEEIDSWKKAYIEGKIDEIRYHYTLSLLIKNIAEDEFAQGNHMLCNESIVSSLGEFITSVKLLSEGKETNQATKINIENKINSGYFGYYALITSDYDDIPKITKENSSIIQMLSGEAMDEDTGTFINVMENAISLRDSKKFEAALANRIREIRKFNLDNYVCADFISIALVKEAKKVGMNFNSEYIEVDLK